MEENKTTDIVSEYIEYLEKKYLSLPEDSEIRKKFVELKFNNNGLSEEEKEDLLKEYPDIPNSLIKLIEYFGNLTQSELPLFATNYFSKYKDESYSWEDGEYTLNSFGEMIRGKEHVSWFKDQINRVNETDVIDEKITTNANNVKWLEIGQMMNSVPDYLFIDFSPSEKGKKGQVILVESFDEITGIFVVADSFDEFLREIIKDDYNFIEKVSTLNNTFPKDYDALVKKNKRINTINRIFNTYSILFLIGLLLHFISFFMIGHLNDESEMFTLFFAMFILLFPVNIVILIMAVSKMIKLNQKQKRKSIND